MTDRGAEFPTPLAARLTGVSVATLDNWERRGFLTASIHAAGGHGVARVYSFRDLVAIRVARELKQEGIPLRALRKVVQYLCAGTRRSPPEALTASHLITDGRDVYEVKGKASVSTLRFATNPCTKRM